MKILRTLAVLIFLLGTLYVVASIPMFLTREPASRPVADRRANGQGAATDAALLRQRFLLSGAALATSGLISMVASVGLFRRKEWSRKSWLYIALLVVLIHAAWFLFDFLSGGLGLRYWAILATIALIYFAPLIYLTKPATKALFVSSSE